MQVTPHVYACHVDDGAVGHPGGSNNYFVGDPTEEMILIDTGQHDRSWTQQIIDYYEELGKPKIAGIAITHGHADHYGGLDKVFDAMGEPEVRCHPKLVKTLETLVPKEQIVPLRSREVLRTGGALRCGPSSRRATRLTTCASTSPGSGCSSRATQSWGRLQPPWETSSPT